MPEFAPLVIGYLDTGGGSMLFQSLIAFAISALFFLRQRLRRLLSWLSRAQDARGTTDEIFSADERRQLTP